VNYITTTKLDIDIPKKLVPFYKKVYNYIVIRIFWRKHKRIILITLAVLFLAVLFLIKRTTIFEKTTEFIQDNQEGLTYNTATIGELVEKDTDGDTIPDWQEPLYGLDPTTKETVPGIPDITTINKLRAEQGLTTDIANENIENLTETEKFARELFSTATSLTQSGLMNQSMVDNISTSLNDRIKNSAPKKIYTLADIKITDDNTALAVQKYKNDLTNIYKKYTYQTMVEEVLAKFAGDGTTIDENALAELDPIITQTQNIINARLKMAVPSQLAQSHLNVINAMERWLESVGGMKLFSSDPILALMAIKNYQENVTSLQSAVDALDSTMNEKL